MTDAKKQLEQDQMEKEIEKWKVKQLIQNLKSAKGNGTSMITVMIPPGDQINLMAKKLNEELGAASNIKSQSNRDSVKEGITSVLHRLKLYNKLPPNGIIVYSGTVITDENKEKKITIDLEPFRPVMRTMYHCDNKFNVEALEEMLQSDDKFGFIVMDGNGCLFGTVCGNTRAILHKFNVELPKKHGRGGQSALRFARIRMERRHNYVRKVAELATQFFITQDKPNVSGIILAGAADFKSDLAQSDLFDQRLQPAILKVVDVAYGSESGFNQAVELSADTLGGVRFVQEKKIITKYFDEIAKDTNMYTYGLEDTLKALEQGAVEKLIVWEELNLLRLMTKNPVTGAEKELMLTPDQADDRKYYTDPETGSNLEVEKSLLVEWLTENYRKFGCSLEFVTNKSQEGSQFVKGFGGFGAILRYQVDFMALREHENEGEGGNKREEEEDKKGGNSYDDFDEDDFM